jgi:hypothetical protein
MPGAGYCPTCWGPFSFFRNRLAEALASKVIYPCKYTVHGCNEKAPLRAMKKHESVCPHRMYHCLVGEEDGCIWTGPRSDILRHTEEKHGDDCIYRSFPCEFYYETFNILEEYYFSSIFSFCGEIFWVRSESDPQNRKLYEVVQYIGPEDNASKYAYEHRLVSPSGEQKLTFVNVVKSETDELEDIYESRKCFVMEYDTLKMFIQNDTAFKYTVKMRRNK